MNRPSSYAKGGPPHLAKDHGAALVSQSPIKELETSSMTDHTSTPRVPDARERVASVRTEPRPGGSTVLVLLTGGPPRVLIEHRMFLDQYLTRALLHTLAHDLDGIEAPGPTPEAAALRDALRTGDRESFTAAVDGYNDRILSLWTVRGAAA
jgi:hypothetical protein